MEDIKNSKKKFSFIKGLAIYTVALLIIGAAILTVFYLYIDLYEKSRPGTVARTYVQDLTVDDLLENDREFFSSLDGNIQSQEEVRAFMDDVLSDLSYARQFDGGEQAGYVYALEAKGERIGSFILTETGRSGMGLARLQVSQTSFDWSVFCREQEFTVPEGWAVSCNGFVLDPGYITQTGVHYRLLEEFYDDGFALPTLVTYRSGRYLGDVETVILDESGQPLDPAAVDEKLYTDNCTDEEKAAITAFTEDYIYRYVRYLSGVWMDAGSGYYWVSQLVLPGSDLNSRLLQAIQGLYYASSKSDEIQSITVNEVMNVGGGRYVCDVTYLVETLGQADYVTTTNYSKLVLVQTDYGLRAEAQASY